MKQTELFSIEENIDMIACDEKGIYLVWKKMDYELPVRPEGNHINTRELLRIREDWLTRLTMVSELTEINDAWREHIREFTGFLLKHQLNFKGDGIDVVGAWCIPEDPSMPSDARVDFMYMPTYIAVSWLSLVRQQYPDIAREFSDFDEVFRKGLKFASYRNLQGHGYEGTQEALIAIGYLALGRTFEFIRDHRSFSPRFKIAIKKAEQAILERLEDNEGWGRIEPEAASEALAQLRCNQRGYRI